MAGRSRRSAAEEALGASLDEPATFAAVVRAAVPSIADWCALYVVGDDGGVRRLAAAHADPAKNALLQELGRYPLSPDPTHPVRRAIASRAVVVPPVVDPAAVDRYATDPDHARILRGLRSTSATVVPLVARDRVVGALSLGRADDSPVDAAAALDLAERAALAIDNARLYRRAEEAIRTRDELLAAASHDLRAPLTAVLNQAQLLERRLGRLTPADREPFERGLASVVNGARRMAELIDELLDIARLRAGRRLELRPGQVDLVEVTRGAIGQVQRAADRATIRLEHDAPRVLGMWDRNRLERVLVNLVSNAVKYGRGAEVVVRVAREERDGAAWATVAVADRGVGIPAADLPRVFEPYYRGANVARAFPGEGIGLAGSKQIVEQHGGTIEVESAEGVGTTFTVRLPL